METYQDLENKKDKIRIQCKLKESQYDKRDVRYRWFFVYKGNRWVTDSQKFIMDIEGIEGLIAFFNEVDLNQLEDIKLKYGE